MGFSLRDFVLGKDVIASKKAKKIDEDQKQNLVKVTAQTVRTGNPAQKRAAQTVLKDKSWAVDSSYKPALNNNPVGGAVKKVSTGVYDMTAKPIFKGVNTLGANFATGVRGVHDLGRLGKSSLFDSEAEYQRLLREVDQHNKKGVGFGKNGGLFNAGTTLQSPEELRDGKRFVGSMIETGTDLGSLVPTGKAVQAGATGMKALKPLVTYGGANAVMNASGDIGRQYRETGKWENKGSTALSAGIGAAIPVAGYGAGRVAKSGVIQPTTKLVSGAKTAIQRPIQTLKDNNIIAPSRLNPDEVTDLSRWRQIAGTGQDMGPEGQTLYQRGMSAAKKAGIDPYSNREIDNLLQSHRNYEMNKPFNQGGYVRNPFYKDNLDPLMEEARKYKSAEEFVKAQTNAYHGTDAKFDTFDNNLRGAVTQAQSARNATFFTDNPDVAKAYATYAAENRPVIALQNEADRLEKIAQRTGNKEDWLKYDAVVAKIEEVGNYDNTFNRRSLANVKNVKVSGDFLEVDAKGKSPQELSADGNIDSWLQQQIDKAKAQGKDGVKFTNLDDGIGLYDVPSTHYAVFDNSKVLTDKQLTDLYNQAKKSPIQKLKNLDKKLGQGGFVRNPLVNPDGTPRIGKGAPIEKTDLLAEASKYKTADEFIKAQGEPFYHGTTESFDNFELKRTKRVYGDLLEYEADPNAIFFTKNKDSAWQWADNRAGDNGKRPRVIEAYPNAKNTYDLRANNIVDSINITYITKKGKKRETSLLEYLRDVDPYFSKLDNQQWGEFGVDANGLEVLDPASLAMLADEKEFVRVMKELGYDSAIFNENMGGDSLAVFDPSQIKTKQQLTDLYNQAKKSPIQKLKNLDKKLGQGGFVRNPLVNPDGTPRIGKGAPIEKTPLDTLKKETIYTNFNGKKGTVVGEKDGYILVKPESGTSTELYTKDQFDRIISRQDDFRIDAQKTLERQALTAQAEKAQAEATQAIKDRREGLFDYAGMTPMQKGRLDKMLNKKVNEWGKEGTLDEVIAAHNPTDKYKVGGQYVIDATDGAHSGVIVLPKTVWDKLKLPEMSRDAFGEKTPIRKTGTNLAPTTRENAILPRVGDTPLPIKQDVLIGDSSPLKKGNTRPDPLTTVSGRKIQLPQYNPRNKSSASITRQMRAWDETLIDAAIEEAKYKNDSMNLSVFTGMKKSGAKNLSQSDQSSLNLYLFGDPDGIKLSYGGKTPEPTPRSFTEKLENSIANKEKALQNGKLKGFQEYRLQKDKELLDAINQSKGAPIEKTPTLQDALEGKSTKVASATTPKIKPNQTLEQTSPQNLQQTNQTSQLNTGTKPQAGQTQRLDQSVQNSSTPIIQQEARPKTAKEVTKQISSKDAEIYVKTNTKIKVDQRGNQKLVDVNKIDKTKTGATKTNLKTGKVTSYMIDDKGEFVPDSNGAYKIVTGEDGKLTQIRIGDEVYTADQIGDLTNIKNYGSVVATQRRNLERAIPDEKTRNTVISLVVDHQQHQATKMVARHAELKKGMQGVLDDLGISFGIGRHKAKKVSAAIQDFGEGKRDYDSLVQEYGKPYADKIVNADKWFRQQYDTLLEEMNTTLTRYGYDPIPKRANYYTHFQDETLWRRYGLKMQEINEAFGTPMQEANPTGTRGSISNQMAGQSEFMTPNKRFNPFAQQRKGDQHTADAFGAFERYMSPTLNNIYMTPSITRARVIAKAIAMENDRVGNNVNLVVSQMREWANHLAGKSQQLDRFMIDRKGLNQILRVSNAIQKKVGGNSIVGNLATAIMQPIVLAQTSGKAGYKNTLLAMMQELSTAHSNNAAIRKSEFLRRRYTNVEAVTRGKVQRGADIAGVPLKVIEETSARITWNAHYNSALEKGLKGADAIKYADIEAEKTMAGRSIGEKPELYRSKAAGPVTQFMLEVNNYIQQVGKEMTPAQIGKTFVAAYGINLLLQEATGRSVGFNPIDAAVDSIGILADDDKDGGQKAKEVGQRWLGETIANIPGATNVLDVFMDDQDAKKVFGTQTPIGRYGVGSTYGQLYDNTIGKAIDGKYLEAAAYTAMPWGYNQAQKTVKGIKAVYDGKLTDKDGNTIVEIPQTPGNFAKGALFGPSAIDEVNQYYNNIGVKKEDQKPVQNQTNSKAAKQGVVAGTGTTKLTLDEAKTYTKKRIENAFGKEYANMNQDELKELAKTDKNAKEALQMYKDTAGAFGTGADLPDSLKSDTARRILDRASRSTNEGWGSLKSPEKEVSDTLSKWLPNKIDLPPVTNATAKKWAEYEKKRADGTLGKLEAESEKKTILRDVFNSQLNEDEKDLYKLSKARLLDAYERGVINDENVNKALAVEKQLYDAGLIDSETLRKKLGLSSRSKSGSYSRSSAGTRSKKAKAIKSRYDLTKLFAYSPVTLDKSLRELVEKASKW